MQARFGQSKVKVLGLVPTIAQTYSIKDVSELFKADLPSPQLLSTDWKIRCTSIPLDNRLFKQLYNTVIRMPFLISISHSML